MICTCSQIPSTQITESMQTRITSPSPERNYNPDTVQTNHQPVISWTIKDFQSNRNLLLAIIQESQPEIIMPQDTLTMNILPTKLPGYIVYYKPKLINSSTMGR